MCPMKNNKLIRVCLIIITISVVAYVGNLFFNQYKSVSTLEKIASPISEKVDPNFQWCKEHKTSHDVSSAEYPCLKHKPY